MTAEAEVRRIEMLFDRLPSIVIVSLIGIFLCFLVLFDTATLAILKVWTAYMLSVLAMRTGIWYLFGKADRHSETIYRWEWAYACGALLTGLGWGALFGPLYPPVTHPDAQMFVALMVVITAFTGSIFVALSNITFWLFILPVLTPAIVHYVATLCQQGQWPVTAAACCIAVFVIIQRTLYQSATRNLNRSTQAETLLAEQQAIFDSSPLGIAVTDGTQFWAELSGRKMPAGLTHSVWMVADVTLRVANEGRSRQRDPV